MEIEAILVQNLLDAFRQLNQFVGLGLATSVSALALGFRSRPLGEGETIDVPGVPVPMSQENAQLVLVGIAFVAGLMGSNAADSSANIVELLADSPDILAAACTYASVATAPVGIGVLAAALPVIFVFPVFWRKWGLSSERGIGVMFLVFAAPYLTLALMLARTSCRAS